MEIYKHGGSADFQVCRVAGFQIRRLRDLVAAADLEIGDTAGWEICAAGLLENLLAFPRG